MSRLKGIIENKKGITLIELLIAISILGVVLAIATSMIIQAYNIVPPGTRRMSAKQMAEMHVTEISRHVRNAYSGDIDNMYNYDGETIELGDRTFNNIADFEIAEEENSVYRITLIKRHEEEEGKVTTVVTLRNQ